MALNRIQPDFVNIKYIKEYWQSNPCNEWFFGPGINCKNVNEIDLEQFKLNSSLRYFYEPEVLKFGNFESLKGLNVLEVGYGLGSDAVLIATSAFKYEGVDLSQKSYDVTSRRLKLNGISNFHLNVGSCTNLEFAEDLFDFVYSWGVIHHSGDIKKSLSEIYRVLKKGGRAKIMVYNKDSIVVFIYWLLYSLKDFNFGRKRSEVIARYVESPGTLILSKKEFSSMLKRTGFKILDLNLYRDFFYLLRKYPPLIRPFIRFFAKILSIVFGGEKNIGYFMCVDVVK